MHKKNKALRINRSEEVQVLGKELRISLRRDRQRRVEKVSIEIEERLEKQDIIGAFDILKHWYQKFSGRAVKPTQSDLETTRKTYEDLFKKVEMEE